MVGSPPDPWPKPQMHVFSCVYAKLFMNVVLREIEEEDRLWQSKAKYKQQERKKAIKEAKEEAAQERPMLNPNCADISTAAPSVDTESNETEVASGAARPGFY